MSATTATRPETVDEYLAAVPDDARHVLEAVRGVIRDVAPDASRGGRWCLT
jgi:uncharacterized protein YdhG (YjbR/CyaY superfamily)